MIRAPIKSEVRRTVSMLAAIESGMHIFRRGRNFTNSGPSLINRMKPHMRSRWLQCRHPWTVQRSDRRNLPHAEMPRQVRPGNPRKILPAVQILDSVGTSVSDLTPRSALSVEQRLNLPFGPPCDLRAVRERSAIVALDEFTHALAYADASGPVRE